ncbi:hypothetical protein [Streptomyces mirabilis]|uniref:hypothetical protein n=1 Tax=Streptomyces mirabilis TaxID=68239 RepID=UPI002B1CC112|nr:hypothetical protein [Streptomyces mirabilis]
MNTGDLESAVYVAERKVQKMQAKLHCWAQRDPDRAFDDLFNLVADPAFLLVAWDRVRGNKGARSAGVDGRTVSYIANWHGVEEFLDAVRTSLKDRTFQPLPVKERMIPKANGKLRRLGIPTVRDRVVQASLKLVLEPIFRGGLPTVLVWLPPEPPCTRRYRRDSPFRQSHLRVDRGRRYQGVLR